MSAHDALIIAGRAFTSRLLVGTGKFASPDVMQAAVEASGAEIVTVAVRRVDLTNPQDSFVTRIDPKHFLFLPNTSGARNAEEALRIARIARHSGVSDWVKLEVIPDPNYLMPDPVETLKAAEQLVKEGFTVLPYIQADPVLAKRLEEIGCATVMPLAAPIGSNLGLRTRDFIAMIIEQSTVPVVVDAGLGAPSQAAEAMELGADAVLVNTAMATSPDPVRFAAAFKKAVEAGREAFLAGLPGTSIKAEASSPLTGFLT
ncbi:MAG: thiazole synthase [Candidatus Margulisiibacteriota bacterium]